MEIIKLGLFIVCTLWSINATSQTIEYSILYNTNQCQYEAHAHVIGGSFVYPNTIPLSSQFTIVTPASTGTNTITITEQVNPPNLLWSNNSNVYSPTVAPENDFRSFNIGSGSGGNAYLSMNSGEDIHLFSFVLSDNDCMDGLRVFINNVDPNETEPGMSGIDFKNEFKLLPNSVLNLYDGNVSDNPVAAESPTAIPTVACSETEINLLANASTTCGSIATHSWTGPDNFASAEANPVIAIYDASVQSGTYTLEVEDSKGCATIATIVIDDLNCFPNTVVCGPLLINNNDAGMTAIIPILYKGTTIESDGFVAPGTNVDFEAEDCIDLQAPFEVAPGATFLGEIVPCSEGG